MHRLRGDRAMTRTRLRRRFTVRTRMVQQPIPRQEQAAAEHVLARLVARAYLAEARSRESSPEVRVDCSEARMAGESVSAGEGR